MVEMRNTCNILAGKPDDGKNLGDLGVDRA
jgi:hypothetical protein